MDGSTTKPDWLVPGAFVRVQHWLGIVEDVAVSPSRVMVLVKSPKGIWRNQRDAAEWLEYIEGQITPSDAAELEREIETHVRRVQNMLDDLALLKAQVATNKQHA